MLPFPETWTSTRPTGSGGSGGGSVPPGCSIVGSGSGQVKRSVSVRNRPGPKENWNGDAGSPPVQPAGAEVCETETVHAPSCSGSPLKLVQYQPIHPL